MDPGSILLLARKSEYEISSLPDELLEKILTFLPINDVVATSVLSKRWRFLWKSVTKLNFDEHSLSRSHTRHCDVRFRNMVSRYRQCPVIQSCNLKFYSQFHPEGSFHEYIDLLADLSIREMRIEMTYSTITFPKSLYTKFGTLRTLILERLHLVVPVASIQLHLRSLKTLHLLSVKFSDDESVQRFLSSCPVLENLVVRRSSYVRVAMFNIKVPTLKCLSINYASMRYQPKGDYGFVVDAPSLECLNIRDNFSKVLQFGHMPHLVKANVDIACDQLNSILKAAPRLQVLKVKLKLKHNCVGLGTTDSIDHWNPPCFVPQCLISHLEIFEWRHYNGTKEENKVATYILTNAYCLKKATFSSVSAEKDQIFKKLECVPRLSEACQLFFKEDEVCVHKKNTKVVSLSSQEKITNAHNVCEKIPLYNPFSILENYEGTYG